MYIVIFKINFIQGALLKSHQNIVWNYFYIRFQQLYVLVGTNIDQTSS